MERSSDLNSLAISNPVASPSVTTKFYVTGEDGNNCTVEDSVTVSIIPVPVFHSPIVASVCKGSSVVLDGNNDSRYIYSWVPANLLDNAILPDPTATPDETTVFHLDIADPVCSVYDSAFDIELKVSPVPILTVQKSNDINCSTPSSRLTVSGAESYTWTPASGLSNAGIADPLATVPSTTVFTVRGTNADGCSTGDSITVIATQTCENTFSVPNAFTPNGDNVNDCFGSGVGET